MPPESPPASPPPIVPVPPSPATPLPTDPSVPPPGAVSRNADEDMLEPGEQLLAVVHRHPISIILIYLEALVGVVAIFAVFVGLGPSTISDLSATAQRAILAGVVFGLAILIFFLFVATYVYRQSRLLITDRGLVQVLQSSLFIRKVSRLSMSNVEDVTAEQRGILPTIFNYGLLFIQTAGQVDNFEFPWCPNPNHYADIIIEARQRYAESLKEANET